MLFRDYEIDWNYNPDDINFWNGVHQDALNRFVRDIAPLYGLRIGNQNRQQPNLIDANQNQSMISFQFTPFFKSRSLYSVDPNLAFTLDVRDVRDYENRFPDLILYFWIEYHVLNRFGINVDPICGLWKAGLADLLRNVNELPVHRYAQRAPGNAMQSYLIDLGNFDFIERIHYEH